MKLQPAHAVGTFLIALGVGSCVLIGCRVDAAEGTGTTGTPGQNTGGISSGAAPSGAAGGTVVPVGGGTGGTPSMGTAGSVNGNAGGVNGNAGGVNGNAGSAPDGAGTPGTGGAPTGGGSPGAGGASMGGRPSGPSAACTGAGSVDEPQKAILHELMVTNIADKYKPTYVKRKYYTSLPQGYTPGKPYAMIFYGQGCGQTTAESGPFSGGHFASEAIYIQLIPAVVDGKTVVPSNGAPGCFQAGKQGLADSPDGPYFDMVLAEVEQKYCVDQGKVYVAGWSSGAWLSNYLACARSNVITGTAAGSGGLQYDHGTCVGGGVKAMLLDGDAGSIMEAGQDIGAAAARDTLAAAAGATAPSAAKFGPDNCQLYQGANGSVAWCPVGGGHGGPLNSIADAAWAFWTAP